MDSVREARLRWLLRAAAFLHEGGAEPVSGLVLPTSAYFPDPFDGSALAVRRLCGRMMQHGGLTDVPVELEILTADGASSGGCKSGGCSKPSANALSGRRVVATDDGYAIAVGAGEVGHATMLSTALARAAAAVFLGEAGLDAELDAADYEPYVDVAGALLGFGVLLANGSHMLHKGCGGVSVQSATALPVEEQVALLAIFGELHRGAAKTARSELDAVPRGMLSEATQWATANAGVIGLVKSDRRALDADAYQLSRSQGWFGRSQGWFGRLLGVGGAKAATVPSDDELERIASTLRAPKRVDAERARRLAALRELVDEQLD